MNQFSSGLELGNFQMSSDLLHNSWNAIFELYEQTHQNDPSLLQLSVACRRSQYPPNVTTTTTTTIIAFDCSPSPTYTMQHLQGEGKDLVSSATLKENNFPLFEFLCTKVNPSFSINKAAIRLYASLHDELLKEQIDISRPLIITGHSLGGSVASLFTLWLLDNIYSKMSKDSKRPICLTFGSPLLGDDGFQRGILERPTWTSCFMHVVSKQDPIPSFFILPRNTFAPEFNSQTCNLYKPFGFFLFCSESGVACFDDPESVLELLGAMSSEISYQGLQFIGYGRVLDCLKYKAICRGSKLGGCDINPFRTGTILQLQTIGVIGMQPQQQNNDKNIITSIEEKQKSFSVHKKTAFNPNKKLNDRKINMANLEWYKKSTRERGGYYDSYKSARSRSGDEIRSKNEIVNHQRILTLYWRNMVREAEKMPQKEGASFLLRWLMAGTTYRRMVEPLDIADYYNKGKRDYITKGRSEHYVLLEKWLNDEKEAEQPSNASRRNRACSLTEDSCFWAHVEEVYISLRALKDGESSPLNDQFEEYVMALIRNYSVDPEIFLEQSSFMKWWREYEESKGSLYNSPLTNYMRNQIYRSYA